MNLTNRDLLIAEWLNAGGVKAKKGILKKLADKYEVPDSTARRWKKEYIEKNGMNVQKNRTGKSERSNELRNQRDLKIKKEILDEVPRNEVMKNNDISYPTYYRKKKELFDLMQKKSDALFKDINKEVFHDIEELLKSLTLGKRNLVSKIINEISKSIKEKREIDLKKVTDNKSVFDILEKLIKSLLSSGGFLTREQINEEMSDLMKQENILKEQEIKMEYLEIEKIKNGVADDNDNKIEIELIEV